MQDSERRMAMRCEAGHSVGLAFAEGVDGAGAVVEVVSAAGSGIAQG